MKTFSINTCCVTNTASSKSLQYIRKAQRYNPEGYIIVCGCLTAPNGEKTITPAKNIFVIENRNNLKDTLMQIIQAANVTSNIKNNHDIKIKAEKTDKIKSKKFTIPPKLPFLTSFKGQTLDFVRKNG